METKTSVEESIPRCRYPYFAAGGAAGRRGDHFCVLYPPPYVMQFPSFCTDAYPLPADRKRIHSCFGDDDNTKRCPNCATTGVGTALQLTQNPVHRSRINPASYTSKAYDIVILIFTAFRCTSSSRVPEQAGSNGVCHTSHTETKKNAAGMSKQTCLYLYLLLVEDYENYGNLKRPHSYFQEHFHEEGRPTCHYFYY